jgi:hypothetical protein
MQFLKLFYYKDNLPSGSKVFVMPMDIATVRNTNANVAVPSWDDTLAQSLSAGIFPGFIITMTRIQK